MILVNFPGSWSAMYAPLEHASWEGTTPTDYIFPFFIFIVGVSIVLSFSKQMTLGKTKKQFIIKILWRTVNIFSLGIFIKVLPTTGLQQDRITRCFTTHCHGIYGLCFPLFVHKLEATIVSGIRNPDRIFGWQWTLIPVPQFGAGLLEPGKNLANWLDGMVIPASLLNERGYDAEGFLSTFPAIVSGISGLIAGKIILSKQNKEQTVLRMFVIGIVLIFIGNIWGWSFPIVKKIWTSSYVLVTSGWAFMVFALLIWLIDINGVRKGTRPWVIFGSNAIAIYFLADVFETFFLRSGLHDSAYTGMLGTGMQPKNASLAWAIFSVIVCYLTAWLMYVRKIFIKL